MKRLCLLVLVPCAAWAETPAPATPSAPTISPVSVGKPHVCIQDYPAESVRLGEQGTTTIRFHITTEGSVSGITVAGSSGSAALDSAAVTCASSWQYRPAMKDGKPVEVPWKAEVSWRLQNPDAPQSDFSFKAERCEAIAHPTPAQLATVQRPTTASVVFTQGRLSSWMVVYSSGNRELDAQAARCFDHAQFNNPDGTPLSAPRTVAVEWR